ncbi:hypothetical protein ACKI10_22015 [Streptomyces galilaeus]|uniref:Uncharacterized protein n=1 Tax=Streptomyces galilaeus TaxID=33899 RepID=A0ABW9IEM7_STRGJ
MTNGTAPPPVSPVQRPGITLRVYTVDRHGTVTSDTGTRMVPPATGPLPVVPDTYYPPCQCEGCRPGVAR